MIAALARKEATEWVRTGRLWILLGLLAFLAVLSAVTAWVLPLVLGSVDLGGGIEIEVPDPTWRDAALQWEKNLTQIGTVAVVLLTAGSVAKELTDGTARHLVTMGVPRRRFVLTKAASALIASLAVTGGASVLAWVSTLALLPDAELPTFLGAAALWWVHVALLACLAVLGALTFGSTVAGAGVALGAWAVLGLLGIWTPAVEYGPSGVGAASAALAAGAEVTWVIPVLTAGVLAVIVVGLAVVVFARREL